MSDSEQLSELIGDIYDAALDPAQRTDVLDRLANFTGGQSGGLLLKHSVSRSENLYCYIGSDPEGLQAHSQGNSPLVSTLDSKPGLGSVVQAAETVPSERPPLSDRRSKSPGWAGVASTLIERSGASCTFLSITRRRASGPVDADMRRRMALIVPHARRAVLIAKALGLKQADTLCFSDILDGLSAGIILVDAIGRIVHTNAAANAILDVAGFLRTIDGRLVAGDAATRAALREILIAAETGDAAVGVKGIALPMTAQDGERYVAHVLPLTSGARRNTGLAYDAVAALFIRRVVLDVDSSPEIIGRIYKLTPTELRVLFAIVDIGGVPEVAASLGVAVSTIKTHLKRLFEKTGVGRQADLVKLVAGFSTPLAR